MGAEQATAATVFYGGALKASTLLRELLVDDGNAKPPVFDRDRAPRYQPHPPSCPLSVRPKCSVTVLIIARRPDTALFCRGSAAQKTFLDFQKNRQNAKRKRGSSCGPWLKARGKLGSYWLSGSVTDKAKESYIWRAVWSVLIQALLACNPTLPPIQPKPCPLGKNFAPRGSPVSGLAWRSPPCGGPPPWVRGGGMPPPAPTRVPAPQFPSEVIGI